MRKHYDFSKGERGPFRRTIVRLRIKRLYSQKAELEAEIGSINGKIEEIRKRCKHEETMCSNDGPFVINTCLDYGKEW